MRERARDLVLRVGAVSSARVPPRAPPPGPCRGRSPARAARVLDGDADLGGERCEQRALARAQRARPGGVRREQPDRLVPDHERHRERRADPGLRLRMRGVQARPWERRPPRSSRRPSGSRATRSATPRPPVRAVPRARDSRRRRSGRPPRGGRRRRDVASRSAIFSTAVSSVCESERREIASPMTSSRARLRSSSKPASRARSDARSAWAARTAKLASRSRPASSEPGRGRSGAGAHRARAGRAAG